MVPWKKKNKEVRFIFEMSNDGKWLKDKKKGEERWKGERESDKKKKAWLLKCFIFITLFECLTVLKTRKVVFFRGVSELWMREKE